MNSDMSMGLDVTIRGNADSLVTAANQGESSIKGLEGVSAEALGTLSRAIQKLDLDFVKWTETSKGTENQVRKTAEVAKSEGAQVEGFADKLLQHNYAVARGLEAVGLSSEASAARVGGALEAIKTAMSGLNPVLLSLTAGAGAMFAGFELLKTSAEAASKWDQNMALLGQTVRNQSGDWAKLRDTVKEWADLQEKTTDFSRDEAVDALRLLTSAGTSLSDSMKIVRVAEDAAAATGHSLTDVVHGLMEAEHGRTQVLAELGIGSKAAIKDGMSLRDILNEIEKHMGGAAAAAATTYAGKLSQLQNAIEALKEDLGEKLLPYMTKFVDTVKDWVDTADANLPKIEQRFQQVYDAGKAVVDFLDKSKDVIAYFFGTIIAVQAVRALSAAVTGFNALRGSIIATTVWQALTQAVQTFSEYGLMQSLYTSIWKVAGAFDALKAAEAGATLGLSLFIGWIVDGHFQDAVNIATKGIASLIDMWGKLAVAVGQFTNNSGLVALGMAAEDTAAAGASGTPTATTDQQRGQWGGWAAMWGKKPGAPGDGNPADTNVTGNPQVGGSGSAPKGKAQIPTLGAGQATVLYDDSIKMTTRDQQKFTDALYATGDALGKQILGMDKSIQQNHQKNEDERKTYGMSIAQQIAYYQDKLANQEQYDSQNLELHAQLVNKIDDLQTQAYKQQYDDAKKAHDDQVALIKDWANKGVDLFNTFFENGKNGFKSFSDAFKKMLDDMLQALERSALTNLLAKIFNVDISGNFQPNLGGAPVTSSSGIGGGANGLLSFLGGSASTASVPYDSTLANAYMSAGMSQSDAVAMASSTAGSSSKSMLGGLGGGIPFGKNIGGASVGSYLAAAAGGAMIGQTVFGGKGYADVGGAMGAAAALALAGPAGWAAIAAMTLGGALLGGGAGSLFGNHFDPANEPDIYQQDAWGQENADMTGGEWTANGKQYNPDSWTNQLTHNKGWNIVMENFVQKFRGKTGQLPQSLQSVFSNIEQLWGGASGQADFNHDGKDGYLDIGSGKRAKWTEFWQYVQAYGPQIAQLMDNYQPANVYDASNGTATMAGSYTPSGSPWILHDFPDYGGGMVPVSSGGGGGVHNPIPPGGGGGGGHGVNPEPPNGGPIGGGGGHVRSQVAMLGGQQVVIHQHIQGDLVTQDRLYAKAGTAIAQQSRTGIARRMSMVRKG